MPAVMGQRVHHRGQLRACGRAVRRLEPETPTPYVEAMSDTFLTQAGRALRSLVPSRFRSDVPTVPVVRLGGTIGFSTPLRPGLTLSSCARLLDRAFTYRKPAAVALLINSPGGSAVQSHLIFKRIRKLSEEKSVPVIAFTARGSDAGMLRTLHAQFDGYLVKPASPAVLLQEIRRVVGR